MGDHNFPSEMYCVTVPKKIVQQSFSVSLIRVSRIFLHCKDNHEFLSKVFVSQCRKKMVDESFGVSFNFGYRKNLCIRGVYHDILSKNFCLTVSKKIVQESFSVSLIRVLKIFMH